MADEWIDLEDVARGKGQAAREARRTLKRRAGARGTVSDLSPLTDALDDLAARLGPSERLALSRQAATYLRGANAARIRANVTPEGEPMVPRKAVPGGKARTKRLRPEGTKRAAKVSERQAAMFRRATGPAYLRRESSAGEAQVGYVGAMARIMRVHQYGLRDTVTRIPNSPEVTYPARAVLGMPAEDRLRILEMVAARAQP